MNFEYLRPKQAAGYLGIGLSTLWAWAKKRPGFPKARKLSGRVTVFLKSELDAWCALYGVAILGR